MTPGFIEVHRCSTSGGHWCVQRAADLVAVASIQMVFGMPDGATRLYLRGELSPGEYALEVAESAEEIAARIATVRDEQDPLVGIARLLDRFLSTDRIAGMAQFRDLTGTLDEMFGLMDDSGIRVKQR